MNRFSMFFVGAMTVSGVFASNAQAQSHTRPLPPKIHYNAPSHYVQPPVPMMPVRPVPTRPAYGSIDCSPTIGFYGDLVRGGMKVTHVVRRTEASRIGLQPGDVIVSVDGQRIRTQRDWDRAMDRAGREVCLTVENVHGRVRDLHARVSHNHHHGGGHGHNHQVLRPVPPSYPTSVPMPGYVIPQQPRTAYHFNIGDQNFQFGFSVRD